MPGQHKKGKKALGIYLDEKFIDKVKAEAKRRGVPTTVFVENVLRKELGLEEIEPSQFTPKAFISK